MKTVEPIRDKEKIELMCNILLKYGSDRNYMLFFFGINTGLRISDMLKTKKEHIFKRPHKKGQYVFREFFELREKKTRKLKKFRLNAPLKRKLLWYCGKYEMVHGDYLFWSQKRKSRFPISRVQAYRILKEAAITCKIDGFGTQSMRKTCGYFAYQKSKDLVAVMNMLNHTNPDVTLRYIGVRQDKIDSLYSDLGF